jgi:Histone methylation protein DOT1
MDFRHFSSTNDLHGLSHRGLTQHLIPAWLKERSTDLDGDIESSAYGETPSAIADMVLELLDIHRNDVFLDLGAGAGNLLQVVSKTGAEVHGLERNSRLVESGQAFLSQAGVSPGALICADFLSCSWPEATKAYAASARYSRRTLRTLSQRIEVSTTLQKVACLGRGLSLAEPWQIIHQSQHSVVWNHGEPATEETLFVWSHQPKIQIDLTGSSYFTRGKS